jgi:hypothetical protein
MTSFAYMTIVIDRGTRIYDCEVIYLGIGVDHRSSHYCDTMA